MNFSETPSRTWLVPGGVSWIILFQCPELQLYAGGNRSPPRKYSPETRLVNAQCLVSDCFTEIITCAPNCSFAVLTTTAKNADVCLRRLDDPFKTPVVLYSHRSPVTCLAVSPDSNRVASGGLDGCIRLRRLDSRRNDTIPDTENVLSLLFSNDGLFLYAITSNLVARYAVATLCVSWRQRRTVKGTISALAYSPSGAMVAVGADDSAIQILSSVDAHYLSCCCNETYGKVTALEFCGRQTDILCAGYHDGSIVLWNPASGQLLAHRHAHSHEVAVLRFAVALQAVISGSSADDNMCLWTITGTFPTVALAPPPLRRRTAEEIDSQWMKCRDEQAIKAVTSCVVCLEAQRDIVLLPCGHFCLCTSCFDTIWNLRDTAGCPLCKTPIQRGMKAILA